MAYATRADLRLADDLLVYLTDQAGVGVADDAAIGESLERASARVDRHIGQRYTLPWADSEGQLRDLTVALARYDLYTLRPDGPEVPAVIRDGRDQAERDLRDIAAGKLSLGGNSLAPDASPSEPAKVVVRGPERAFPRDLMDKW